ncbi:hypothetical protein NEISUBOT_04488 [Neisseria subflava NJ9703]|uniref:Uncharacterized protein n=1 Tax=Neisseria subflava NJ9703 TaxID=546268 RepID=A0A9W5MZC4_NEISU|nr:hypothetical protein NEISUBOT_04488 [Neisseria subflava NJ9703]
MQIHHIPIIRKQNVSDGLIKKGRLKPHILSKCRNPVIKKNKKHLPALFLGV